MRLASLLLLKAALFMPDDRIDRIVESLQAININIEGLRFVLQSLSDTMSDHEDRLRDVERWKNSLPPLVAGLTFLLGVLATGLIQRLLP